MASPESTSSRTSRVSWTLRMCPQNRRSWMAGWLLARWAVGGRGACPPSVPPLYSLIAWTSVGRSRSAAYWRRVRGGADAHPGPGPGFSASAAHLVIVSPQAGGQRFEHRKWIHRFLDITVTSPLSILFLVSLSGYNQCLLEDRDTRGEYGGPGAPLTHAPCEGRRVGAGAALIPASNGWRPVARCKWEVRCGRRKRSPFCCRAAAAALYSSREFADNLSAIFLAKPREPTTAVYAHIRSATGMRLPCFRQSGIDFTMQLGPPCGVHSVQ
ncbi:hypothetical protein C8R45DRAFT_1073376 [Mycena sanguinolenta]|nr:hypothetical protein C8R45DRAFT_1073376 [Mycena sanguinolenta]